MNNEPQQNVPTRPKQIRFIHRCPACGLTIKEQMPRAAAAHGVQNFACVQCPKPTPMSIVKTEEMSPILAPQMKVPKLKGVQ